MRIQSVCTIVCVPGDVCRHQHPFLRETAEAAATSIIRQHHLPEQSLRDSGLRNRGPIGYGVVARADSSLKLPLEILPNCLLCQKCHRLWGNSEYRTAFALHCSQPKHLISSWGNYTNHAYRDIQRGCLPQSVCVSTCSHVLFPAGSEVAAFPIVWATVPEFPSVIGFGLCQ